MFNKIFAKSPWDDLNSQDNIFTRKHKNSFGYNNFNFNFNKKTLFIIILALLLIWLGSGIYKVQEGEEAAVCRFGKFDRIGRAGLNYHFPYPIETILIEKVAQSRRIEIGYRSLGKNKPGSQNNIKEIMNESIMLTGDENIVELNADVMWHIYNLEEYLFNVINPQDTVKSVAESAIREIIGNISIASVLSNEKQIISDKIETLISQTLKQYKIGIEIEQVQLLRVEPPKEVIHAYRDVQMAKADKEKEINQAQSYSNDIIPKARGDAAKILEEAAGYSAEAIAQAKGNTSRFNSIYFEYLNSKEITRNRLYIDALEKILNNAEKIIIENDLMLPHMSIPSKNS